MSDNEQDKEPDPTPEPDKVVEDIKDDLKDGGLTVEHLKALETRLEARIQMLSKDKSKGEEDKAALQAQLESLGSRLDDLIRTAEERDKPRNDESTIVIPPKELDPPTHQNSAEVDAKPENQQGPPKKKRMAWW